MSVANPNSIPTTALASPRAVLVRLTDSLTEAITAGQIVPGQRLVEADLQQQYGVSRSSVREALQLLQASGLVVIEANKGAAVRQLTPQDLQDLFAIREQLEGLAALTAAQRIAQSTTAQRRLQQLLQRMDKAASRDDALAYNQLNQQFHALVVQLSGNAQLAQLIEQLNLPLLAHQFRGFMKPANQQASHQEHQRIGQALMTGDAKSAQRLMQQHVRAGLKLVKAWATHPPV
jgi:DNA-binding GntR family transcriptional regulator